MNDVIIMQIQYRKLCRYVGMHTQHRKLVFYLNGDYDCVADHKYNNVFLVFT